MMPRFPAHTVTIIRPGVAAGVLDDVEADWSRAVRTERRAEIQLGDASEVIDARDAQITTARLWIRPATALAPLDRVEWGGYTFEVVGDVLTRYTPGGRPDHAEATLRSVAG